MDRGIICKGCGGNKWKLSVGEYSKCVIMLCDSGLLHCDFGAIQKQDGQHDLRVKLSSYQTLELKPEASQAINI